MNKTLLSLIALAPLVANAVTVSNPTLIDYISSSTANALTHSVTTTGLYGWVDWQGGSATAPGIKSSGGAAITASATGITSQVGWSDNRLGVSWDSAAADLTAWGFNASGFASAAKVNINFGITTAGSYDLFLNVRANDPGSNFLQFAYTTNVPGVTPPDLVNATAAGFATGSGSVQQAYFKFTYNVTQSDIDAGVNQLGLQLSNISGAGQVMGLGDAYVSYTPIPEPSTYGAIAGVLALAGAVAFRRRKTR